MRTKLGVAILSALLTGAMSVPAQPASAVGIRATGDIFVYPDLKACATVNFHEAQSFIAGELSVVGSTVSGQQTDASEDGLIADAQPVFYPTTMLAWSGCVAGAGSTVRNGAATYTFEVSGSSADLVIVKTCLVRNGAMTCTAI